MIALFLIIYFYASIVIYNCIIIFLHNIQEESKSKNDNYKPILYKKSFNPFYLLKYLKQ